MDIDAFYIHAYDMINNSTDIALFTVILNWSKQMKVIRMLSGLSSLQILLMSIMKCILNQEQLVR